MAAKKKKAKAAPKKKAKATPKKKAKAKAAPKKKAKAAPKKKAVVAKPRPATVEAPVPAAVAPKPAGPVDPAVELAHAVAALALDKKAEDVVILKVTDLTSYADCFILASAPSERQVQAIARHVDDEMRKAGKAPVGTEGLEQGHWVLVDMGAAVLHVFLSSARQYYDLEGFWTDAPRVEVDEKHGLDVLARMREAREQQQAAAG
jgi:ribosome-associated protein